MDSFLLSLLRFMYQFIQYLFIKLPGVVLSCSTKWVLLWGENEMDFDWTILWLKTFVVFFFSYLVKVTQFSTGCFVQWWHCFGVCVIFWFLRGFLFTLDNQPRLILSAFRCCIVLCKSMLVAASWFNFFYCWLAFS